MDKIIEQIAGLINEMNNVSPLGIAALALIIALILALRILKS